MLGDAERDAAADALREVPAADRVEEHPDGGVHRRRCVRADDAQLHPGVRWASPCRTRAASRWRAGWTRRCPCRSWSTCRGRRSSCRGRGAGGRRRSCSGPARGRRCRGFRRRRHPSGWCPGCPGTDRSRRRGRRRRRRRCGPRSSTARWVLSAGLSSEASRASPGVPWTCDSWNTRSQPARPSTSPASGTIVLISSTISPTR